MNSLFHDMQFTCEDQTDYEDDYLPTLDFKMKLDKGGIPTVRYRFYKKPISTQLGILKSSALPENIKSATATQEIIRRLSNTDRREEQSTKNNILEDYFLCLKMSGYSVTEIRKFAVDGIKGYTRRDY